MIAEESGCPFAGAASEFENAAADVPACVPKCQILHLTIARYHSQLQFVIFARQPIERVTAT
jgi:hypothetical protein